MIFMIIITDRSSFNIIIVMVVVGVVRLSVVILVQFCSSTKMPWDWLGYEHEWLCSECCKGIPNDVWQFWGCFGLNPDIQGRRVRPRVVYVDEIGNIWLVQCVWCHVWELETCVRYYETLAQEGS